MTIMRYYGNILKCVEEHTLVQYIEPAPVKKINNYIILHLIQITQLHKHGSNIGIPKLIPIPPVFDHL